MNYILPTEIINAVKAKQVVHINQDGCEAVVIDKNEYENINLLFQDAYMFHLANESKQHMIQTGILHDGDAFHEELREKHGF